MVTRAFLVRLPSPLFMILVATIALIHGTSTTVTVAASPAQVHDGSPFPDSSSITLCFVGDIMLDRGVRVAIRRWGVGALFVDAAPIFRSADATIGNLECPATSHRSPLQKKYIFRAEPAWLAAVREAGVTHLSVANNHSNDQGREGVMSTVREMEKHGLQVLGYGRDQAEARKPVIIQKDGFLIGIFASVLVPLENWMYRDSLPGHSQARPEQLARDIQEWKVQHPAGRAIVFLHWGVEGRSSPEPSMTVAAHALIQAGADAVLGHHPHVVSPVEIYRGFPIVYSLGNFVFDRYHAPYNTSVIAELVFRRTGPPSLVMHPCEVTRAGPRLIKRTSTREAEKQLLH